MIYILTDPTYTDSVWCRNFLDSLIDQLRKNRMTFGEVFDCVPADAEAVFIIASNYNWTRKTIKRLNSSGIFPILISNNTEHLPGCVYSSVSSDIYGSIKQLLSQIGDKPAAVYGVNTNSLSDISKVDLLFSYSEDKTDKLRLFCYDGSLENCFADFEENGDDIEAVICTSDLAAVSLVRNLRQKSPDRLDSLTIYSLTGGTLSRYYSPYIKSLNIDYSPFGKAAIHLYKMIQKHKYISGVSLKVSWNTADTSAVTSPIEIDRTWEGGDFNRDEEIREMMAIEKLLDCADDIDRSIIRGLLAQKTLAELTFDCFLTENALKYRIKKILAVSGFADRQDLVDTLKKYVHSAEEL